MKELSYKELVDLKSKIQKDKEEAMRLMSDEDWIEAGERLKRLVVDGKAPPKITSRRRYVPPDFEK